MNHDVSMVNHQMIPTSDITNDFPQVSGLDINLSPGWDSYNDSLLVLVDVVVVVIVVVVDGVVVVG